MLKWQFPDAPITLFALEYVICCCRLLFNSYQEILLFCKRVEFSMKKLTTLLCQVSFSFYTKLRFLQISSYFLLFMEFSNLALS